MLSILHFSVAASIAPRIKPIVTACMSLSPCCFASITESAATWDPISTEDMAEAACWADAPVSPSAPVVPPAIAIFTILSAIDMTVSYANAPMLSIPIFSVQSFRKNPSVAFRISSAT